MSLYKPKNSTHWWTDLRDAGGKRLRESTRTDNKAAAQLIHNARQMALWGEAPPVYSVNRCWSDARQAWLAVEDRSDSEVYSLSKFDEKFDDRILSAITGDAVEHALAFCKTAGTYMRYRTMIVAILNVAKQRGWLDRVPEIPKRKDKKKKTRSWLTHEQWDKLYAQLPDHLKGPAMFAVQTGLRQANVLGLRWSNVDLTRRIVWVDAEDTKGNEALTVPLNNVAWAVLDELTDNENDFVFTYANRDQAISEVKTAFKAACVRAGVPDFTWHGLRHTWATWHVQNGTPLDVLQKLGGWKDLRMVMEYAHHAPSYLASFAGNTGAKK